MNRLDYVIVFVSDMTRSVQFYRDVLGLPLKFESPDWTEFATEGTTLALHGKSSAVERPASDRTPAGTCHPGFQVSDIGEFHQKLLERGVRCLRPPQPEQSGTLAVYADPDGLPISIWEPARQSHQTP